MYCPLVLLPQAEDPLGCEPMDLDGEGPSQQATRSGRNRRSRGGSRRSRGEEDGEEGKEGEGEIEQENWADAAAREAAAMIAAAAAEGSRGGKAAGPAQSVLHAVRWRRIVLDEAHCIKVGALRVL